MHKRLTIGLLIISVLLVSTFATAQRSSKSARMNRRVVDGKMTPEQIPDKIAYRMVLLSFSVPENPTPSHQARQAAHLQALGIVGAEADAAREVLRSFQSEYTQFQKRQKDEKVKGARAIKGELVRRTISRLSTVLTPDHMTALDNYVQERKRHMMTTEVEQ